jgi:hypothetical protein
VIHSDWWIRHETIGYDVGSYRNSQESQINPIRTDRIFTRILTNGFRPGLRRKRSDRFLSDPLIAHCKNWSDPVTMKSWKTLQSDLRVRGWKNPISILSEPHLSDQSVIPSAGFRSNLIGWSDPTRSERNWCWFFGLEPTHYM